MARKNRYRFALVDDPEGFAKGRELFIEYANSLYFDLHFQNFAKELDEIEIQYHAPSGGLILVFDDETGVAAGCVAIRRFEDKTAELKRMFVKESYRNKGLGKELLVRAIRLAKKLGYAKILLDTLDTMKPAISIYEKFGFKQISAYRFNPFENARYFELILNDKV